MKGLHIHHVVVWLLLLLATACSGGGLETESRTVVIQDVRGADSDQPQVILWDEVKIENPRKMPKNFLAADQRR